jgi:hypothetical protein
MAHRDREGPFRWLYEAFEIVRKKCAVSANFRPVSVLSAGEPLPILSSVHRAHARSQTVTMNSTIPHADHRCWQRLVTGGAAGIRTSQLALQLLFKRLQGESMTPAQKAHEAYAFFVKYARILGPEISQLDHL